MELLGHLVLLCLVFMFSWRTSISFCFVMLCYVTLHYVMFCYIMLCFVMLYCYILFCYVLLCSVIMENLHNVLPSGCTHLYSH